MTPLQAETTPMIELAEMLVENVEEYNDREAQEIAESWDRSDLIRTLIDEAIIYDED